MATSTRERILDAAMELFGRQGFAATSIVQVERAAGLSTGSGGIYHHFRTKQDLLTAGVERHLLRLSALRDIQHVLTDLGDLSAELTALARYALAELDAEADLLRVVFVEGRTRPDLVGQATDRLVRATYTGFSGWLHDRTGLPSDRADVIAAIGLGALFSARLLPLLLGRTPLDVSDDAFVTTWTRMVHAEIVAAGGVGR